MHAIIIDFKRGSEFEGVQKGVYKWWRKQKEKYQNQNIIFNKEL